MTELVNGQRKSLEPFLYDSVYYYDHQLEGIRQLSKMKNFLLGDDMGLGKSLEALTVATIDIYRGWAGKILIVAPVSLKGNWADEIEKFTSLGYMILGQEVIPGKPGHPDRIKKLGPADREVQIQKFRTLLDPKVLIVNYEQVQPHLDDLNAIKFDIGIFDEAHYIKNYKSARTKACLNLVTKRSFMLTGTPLLNQVNELWPLLHKIDPNGYPRYWPFVQRFCVFGGWKNKQVIGVKNEKELTERLKSVMVRRMKKDVLNLPEVQYIQRRVDLHPEQRKIYDDLIDEMVVNVDGEDQEIDNALTKFLRLKQICGTTLPFTGKDSSSKLDLAIEDALEILDTPHGDEPRKLVVFTQFRDVQEAYCNRLDEANPGIDIWELNGDVKTELRQGVVKSWATNNKPSALVCMSQVAGVGLNMTAARHAQFIDKLFVPGLNQQCVDRLHRIGASETQPIQAYEYICRSTIENRVEQILSVKKKLFGTIVDDSDFKRKLIRELMRRDNDND
jgi:SNF2 family DNA or RNA helicase